MADHHVAVHVGWSIPDPHVDRQTFTVTLIERLKFECQIVATFRKSHSASPYSKREPIQT